jgi:hypothetical protein
MTERDARTQLATIKGLRLLEAYRAAAAETGIKVAVLLGKDSRESRLTLALGPGCKGDGRNGYGISQIDRRFYPGFTSRVHPCQHARYIRKGAEILRSEIEALGSVKAAIAAYNAGTTAVRAALRAGRDPDSVTTGGDYASDVLARATAFDRLLPKQSSSSASTLLLGILGIGTAIYLYQ